MAKLFPFKQQWTDTRDGDIYGITKVKIVSSTDHVEIANAADAALLQTDRTTSDPTFYLTGGGSTSRNRQINIDGATVGSTQVIASRHIGKINIQVEDEGNL